MVTVPQCGRKTYDGTDMVYIVSPAQTAFYITKGAYLYDVVVGRDNMLIFVFKKADTKKFYKEWKSRWLSEEEINA